MGSWMCLTVEYVAPNSILRPKASDPKSSATITEFAMRDEVGVEFSVLQSTVHKNSRWTEADQIGSCQP